MMDVDISHAFRRPGNKRQISTDAVQTISWTLSFVGLKTRLTVTPRANVSVIVSSGNREKLGTASLVHHVILECRERKEHCVGKGSSCFCFSSSFIPRSIMSDTAAFFANKKKKKKAFKFNANLVDASSVAATAHM